MKGIYKITNPKGKVYIGESVDINKRWNQYKNGHYQKQWKLARSIEKYGWDMHRVEVLEACDTDSLMERERYWQLTYNSVKDGLNLKLTGVGEFKTQDSEETSANRSKGQMGRKHTESTKQKLSLIRKGKPKPSGFGDQIRLAKLGTKLTEQHRDHIAESHKMSCIVDGKLYDSCKSAAIILSIPQRTLNHRLHSKNYPNCWFI
jgi:group I intron endonuclease